MTVDNIRFDRSSFPKKAVIRVGSQRFELDERDITELVMRRLLLIEILDELRTEKPCADNAQRKLLIELAHERLPSSLTNLAGAARQAPRMAGTMADDHITIARERYCVRLREGREFFSTRAFDPCEPNAVAEFITPDLRDGAGCTTR